jgi:PAS domain S-box-containing protein
MSSADRTGLFRVSTGFLRTWVRRYGFALIAVCIAYGLQRALETTIAIPHSFLLFYLAILIVALLAGFWPGVSATGLAGLAAYFYRGPATSPAVSDEIQHVGFALFAMIGVAVSWLASSLRHRADRLQDFEKIVEGLHKMVVVVDRNYTYLIANRAFLQYCGKRREDVIGRHVAEVMGLEVFRDTIKEHLDDCFSGKFVQYEMTHRYPKLGERELMIEYLPIQGPGAIDRVACLKRDVTDQKKADHELCLFRTLIEQSNDAIEVVDPLTLRFLDVNDKACQDLGYTREELLRMSVLDIDPNTHTSSHAAFMEKLRTEGSVVSESVHQRKNGSTFPVEISIKYVELDNGYFVTVARDITDRKRAEVTLRESEDRYRDLVEHSEDLVCTHDLRGNLVSVNAGACRVLGYEVGELLRIPMREFIAPEFRGQFEQYLERIIKNGADSGFLCVLAKDGRRRIWEYRNTLRTDVPEPVVRYGTRRYRKEAGSGRP